MSDNDATWYQIRSDIEAYAAEAVKNGAVDVMDEDACREYASESADSSHYVIYTYQSRRLWAEYGHYFGDFEDDANEIAGPNADIDRRITIVVYLGIEAAYMAAFDELREAAELSEDGAE